MRMLFVLGMVMAMTLPAAAREPRFPRLAKLFGGRDASTGCSAAASANCGEAQSSASCGQVAASTCSAAVTVASCEAAASTCSASTSTATRPNRVYVHRDDQAGRSRFVHLADCR